MPVLKQISPVVVPFFPAATPLNTVPSSSNSIAIFLCIIVCFFVQYDDKQGILPT
jgi:hypothetical protein